MTRIRHPTRFPDRGRARGACAILEPYLRPAVGLDDADAGEARAAGRDRWTSLLAPKGAP